MKPVVREMIDEFGIDELGYDFMGYTLRKGDIYTFHHLIVPARKGGEVTRENGAILCGKSSHQYLHIIEGYEHDYFNWITSEMVDMNLKGYLDIRNLKEIDDILREFESKYEKHLTKKGYPLVRSIYRDRKRF